MRRAALARLVLVALLAGGGTGAVASDAPPLREVAEIDDRVVEIAVANRIRKRCDDISARMFDAIGLARRLEAEAKTMGYSDADIRAYMQSEPEKRLRRARRDAIFAARGIDPKDRAALCRMGHEEIARNSQIGALLRAR